VDGRRLDRRGASGSAGDDDACLLQAGIKPRGGRSVRRTFSVRKFVNRDGLWRQPASRHPHEHREDRPRAGISPREAALGLSSNE